MLEPNEDQNRFCRWQHSKIMFATFDNKERVGYTKFQVNDRFRIESRKFIEGEFDKDEFQKMPEEETSDEPETMDVADACNVYYEIHWPHKEEVWKIKRILLIGKPERPGKPGPQQDLDEF